MIIAIDGPAASGKSTISKSLANKLDYIYFSTGTMYRAITSYFLKVDLISVDVDLIVSALNKIDITIDEDNMNKIEINKVDYSEYYYTNEVNKSISNISSILEVRNKLVALQRMVGKKNNLVCEGRDIGTAVFPNANFKFYIDADINCRVDRRFVELTKNDKNLTKDKLKTLLIERDSIDKNRIVSPLKMADNAICIDTTNLSVNEVVNIMYNKINGVSHR